MGKLRSLIGPWLGKQGRNVKSTGVHRKRIQIRTEVPNRDSHDHHINVLEHINNRKITATNETNSSLKPLH